MEALKNKLDMPLLNAEMTMHLLLGQGQEGINFLADNLGLCVAENKEEITVIFYKDLTEKLDTFVKNTNFDLKKPISLVADWTNDPTGDRAGAQVSLGYYLFRVAFENAKIVNTKPLTLKGKKKDFMSKLVRPQRQLYAPPLQGMPINLDEHPHDEETAIIIKDYIMSKCNWEPAYMSILVKCEKNKTYYSVISELDFRSFHSLSGIGDFKKYDSSEEADKGHKEFLQKHIKTLGREEDYFGLRGD